MNITEKYHVYEHDNRLNALSKPTDSYGDLIFSEYGYESEEEAIKYIAQYYRYWSPQLFIIKSTIICGKES